MNRTSRSRLCVRLGGTLLSLGCVVVTFEGASGQAYAPRPQSGKPAAGTGSAAPSGAPSSSSAKGPARPMAAPRTREVQPVAGEEPIRQPAGPAPAGPAPFNKSPKKIPAPADQGQPLGNPAGPVAPQPAPAAAAPVAPDWVANLTPEHIEYVDKVLKFWEGRSDAIEQYKCEFKRLEFDPIFGPKDPLTPKTISTGTIQYGKPDKGLFKVSQIKNFVPPTTPEGKPTYEADAEAIGEHWVCDGKRIFEFDPRAKRVIERPLPAEMQGKAITDGPLPFLFGAKANQIKARYWIRAVTPETVNTQYWLEAVPKNREDAGNFSKVTIIIDQKEYLPEAIAVFAPNAAKGGGRVEYSFAKREAYGKKSSLQMGIASLNLFQREFYEPKVPFGWKKVQDNALLGDAQGAQNGTPQANRPESPATGKLPR